MMSRLVREGRVANTFRIDVWTKMMMKEAEVEVGPRKVRDMTWELCHLTKF